MIDDMVDTSQVVDALRSLVVFGPDQAGAYRELFGPVAEQLGPDVPTKLHRWLEAWARSAGTGIVVLTGNAGTGKTAAAEHFCKEIGGDLPATDELTEVAGAMVAKDASGIHSREFRAEMFRSAFGERNSRKVLLCVNEGILRDAAEDLAQGSCSGSAGSGKMVVLQ